MYGTTSLLMASKGGYQQIVEMLLRHGADTEVAGRAYGTTSLVAAAQHGHHFFQESAFSDPVQSVLCPKEDGLWR